MINKFHLHLMKSWSQGNLFEKMVDSSAATEKIQYDRGDILRVRKHLESKEVVKKWWGLIERSQPEGIPKGQNWLKNKKDQ